MKELKRISIIWGLLLFAIFSLLTFFALKWKTKTNGYFELENKLVSNTKSYFESKYSYPNQGEKKIITFNELKENNIIDEIKYNDDNCDGYTLVTYDKVIDFKGFIKCNNYTTKDYEKYINNN